MKKTKILIMLMILLSGIIILGTNVQAVTDDETTKDTQTGETKKETTEDTDTEDDSEPGDDTDSTELTWTDVSKMKVEITKDSENQNFAVYAEISGITEKSESSYSYYITKSKNEPDTTKESPGNKLHNGKTRCYVQKEMELAGDTYLWVYEKQFDTEQSKMVGKFIVSAYKLERLNYNLGDRLNGYFFSNVDKAAPGTTTFMWASHDPDTKRNIKLKIGTISDNTILRSIQKGENGCLTKLLNYAKSSKAIYTTTVPLGTSSSITDKFKIVDGAYYYVYFELDDENGKYYPVEDVSL